jgi:hypothetical protein
MKLTKILLATTLTVSAASVFANELDHAHPTAPVVVSTTEDQEADAATVQDSTSEVSIEYDEKEKTIAQ